MYEAKNYEHLLGLKGFSDGLLQNHFGLYEGYVKNTNLLLERLKSLSLGTPEYSETQRRFGWEWNGMRLHELYFGNLTKESTGNIEEKLLEKIQKSFGSLEDFKKNFVGVGSMRGIGWVALVYDEKVDALFNVWINEHDGGHLVGLTPLLIMDVFEHAFILDYGMKRLEYIESFMKAIDWEVVGKRLSE
ncbi:MAG: superoxide dismutase [Candidatus Moranbacteria bacterium]|nr:superoxide dismutase [Candidatus Moranbacteria bacterium]